VTGQVALGLGVVARGVGKRVRVGLEYTPPRPLSKHNRVLSPLIAYRVGGWDKNYREPEFLCSGSCRLYELSAGIIICRAAGQ
jgi:hypothetical protein